MDFDFNAGDVVVADLETDRFAVIITVHLSASARKARRSDRGRVSPRCQPRDAKFALFIGYAAACAPARRAAAFAPDVDRHAEDRLAAIGVNRAACDGVSFQWRAQADVYALDDSASLDLDDLRLRLFDHVRIKSPGITNAPALARPVAAARAEN